MAFDLSTAKDVKQELQPTGFNPATAQERTWAQTAKEAFSNIPASGGQFVSGLYEAVTSPLQTAQAAIDIPAGALRNMMPESIQRVVDAPDPEASQRASRIASQIADVYKSRYGSIPQLKETLATDPVGALSDVSMVFSGGAGAASKVPGMARAAKGFQTAAKVTNPLTPVIGGAKYLSVAVPHVLGMTTGTGAQPIQEAYRAGKAGGSQARALAENLRGRVSMTDVLDTARSNLQAINKARQAEYRSGMVNIANDKTVLGFGGIDQSLDDAFNMTSYKGQVKNQRAASAISDVKTIIDDWKSLNPADFHTPEGLDALKQRIGGVLESIPYEEKTARIAVGKVYTSIKDSISQQAPTYAKVMQDYSSASELMAEIERALSLGQKASADTAMRKLQSLMRNNVNTNYGNRLDLAQQLESLGGQQIMPQLAGQSLSSVTPRGLQTATTPAAAYGAYVAGNPYAAAGALLAGSPRLVGEAALATGRGARTLERITPQNSRMLANLLYQIQANTER